MSVNSERHEPAPGDPASRSQVGISRARVLGLVALSVGLVVVLAFALLRPRTLPDTVWISEGHDSEIRASVDGPAFREWNVDGRAYGFTAGKSVWLDGSSLGYVLGNILIGSRRSWILPQETVRFTATGANAKRIVSGTHELRVVKRWWEFRRDPHE